MNQWINEYADTIGDVAMKELRRNKKYICHEET